MDLLVEHSAFLRLSGRSEATIIQRVYAVRRCARGIGRPVMHATSVDLKAWQAGLHLTARSVCTEVMHVSRYLAWCVLEGHRPDNPAGVLIRPKRPRTRPRPVTGAQLDHALREARPPVRGMVVLAAFAGLRAGEVARLQRADVLDTADPPCLFVNGKGGVQRVVPLSPYVLAELRAHGLPPRGAVFRRRDGGALHPAQVSHLAARYLHDEGLDVTLHQFRHYFATACYRASQDLRLVQELLGHADPATTASYTAYADAKGHAVVAGIAPARHLALA